MAEPLRRSWELLRQVREDEEPDLLQRATLADWEEFCYLFSRRRHPAAYSQALCAADGLR